MGLYPKTMKRRMIVNPYLLALILLGGRLQADTNAPTVVLGRIIVPEIELQEAAMSDVIHFLALSSVPVGQPHPSIRQDITRSNVTYRITWARRRDESGTLIGTGPAITLKATNISLLDLFKKVAALADATMEIGEEEIRIQTRRVQPPVAVQNGPAEAPF